MEWLKGVVERARGRMEAEAPAPESPLAAGLETPQERRERWRSIYVIYFTMFQMSLGFSIVLTGVWPYLDKVTAGNYQTCYSHAYFLSYVSCSST